MIALLALLLLQDDPSALVERLRNEDASERRRVQAELQRRGAASLPALLGAIDAVPPAPAAEVERLAARLGSKSWKERNEATTALARLGRPAARLIEARIDEGAPEAAWRLRAALAEIREKAGRDEQLDALRSGAVCELLGSSGDAGAAAALLKLLVTEGPERRPELQRRAADALSRLRPAISPAQAEEAADRTLRILERTEAPLEKAGLIRALGRLGSRTAVAPLAGLLQDRSERNAQLQRAAIDALAAIGDPRALPAMTDALGAEDPYVRRAAATVLSALAGDAFGYDPRASAEENAAAVAKFRGRLPK